MKPTARSITPSKTASTMRISYVISPDEREGEDEAAKDETRASETALGSSAPVLKKETEEQEEGDLVQYMCFSKSVSEQGDGIGEGGGEQGKGSGDGRGIEEGKGKEEVKGGKTVEVKGGKKKKSQDKEEEEKREEWDDTMMWALRGLD